MTNTSLKPARVLITDGDERAALASARSLTTHGCTVVVASVGKRSLAGVSRGVIPATVTASGLDQPAAYAEQIADLCRRHAINLILPITDQAVEALLEFRDRLPTAVELPLPSLATYRRASDKQAILALAVEAGFDVPETVVFAERPSDRDIPAAEFFPAFCKPHRSVVPDNRIVTGKRKLGVTRAVSRASCVTAMAALPGTAFPVLLQREVQGDGEGYFALRWNGAFVAEFAHRRLREKPPGGGVSVFRESIEMPPALRDAGRRLLDALDWQGVAMIECKRDRVTNRHVVMEINGRFWGSLQLAIDAGVDFPQLLVCCALREAAPLAPSYRSGVRSRWFWGDLDHLYLRLRYSRAELGMDDSAHVGRFRALLSFVRTGGAGAREEIWRVSDPMPFLLESSRRFGLSR